MAVPEVLKQRLSASELDQMTEREMRQFLEGLIDGIRAVTAKLDADATVTDTNYTATFDALVTK